MTNKDIALSYLKKGYSVIPVKSPQMIRADLATEEIIKQCKVPLIGWKEFQNRRPTEEEVAEWFEMWPEANIGIVTGKISNLVVFDLDSEDAVAYSEKQGGFPETVKALTGKGYHLYMQHPGFEIRNSVNKDLYIDIRADGGFVVASPSVHGSGRRYEWEEGHSIHEIDPAPCDPWMVDHLQKIASQSKPAKKKVPKTVEAVHTVKKSEKDNKYTDILKNGATEGNRNDTASRLIGHLFAKGIAEDEIWATVEMWNTSKNNPSLSKDELRRTFESVKKLDAENKESEEKIYVIDFLDNAKMVIAEHEQSYVRIPFAGNDLSLLETQMNGGLIGGRFYLLGGIPSASKTMLTNNLADNICLNNHPVLLFSYDDGRSELRYRTFARFSTHGIEDFNQNRINKTGLNAVCEIPEIKKIMDLKYVMENMINIEKWDDLIEQIKQHHQKAPVIMIDYLRKLRTENNSSDERLRVDDILSNLTSLAKKHNIPVVAISELARDSYKSGQRLSMASLKESGNLEYEASWLGILAAVEEINGEFKLKNNWERIIEQDGNVDLIIFKAKRGTGIQGKIPLKVDRNNMTVKDRTENIKVDSVETISRPSMFGARKE
jgi:replicative DNA helicase